MHDIILRLVTTPQASLLIEAPMQTIGPLVVTLVGGLLLAGFPPAVVNSPPAYTLPPNTVTAYTGLLMPLDRGAHAFAAQRATYTADAPPACVNEPPA